MIPYPIRFKIPGYSLLALLVVIVSVCWGPTAFIIALIVVAILVRAIERIARDG